jgi:transcriptional regulator with XRE-family HTH domain
MLTNMAGVKSELNATGISVAQTTRFHRERLGMSYSQLSRKLSAVGRSIPSIGLARIEAGNRRVDVDDLMALALALEVSPITLLMPTADKAAESVKILDGCAVSAERAWNWLNGSYPIDGGVSVLAFFGNALPPWERTAVETAIALAKR